MPLGFVGSLPVVTDRLRLRAYRSDDLDAFAEMWSRSDVVRYLHQEPQDRAGAMKMFAARSPLNRFLADGDRLVLAVERLGRDGMIGEVVLAATSIDHRQGEIGFVFHPAHRGKGFASEAAAAMLALGFERVGFHRVAGRADARNVPSASLMADLGMRPEALLVENEFTKGEWTNGVVYAMLAEEWKHR